MTAVAVTTRPSRAGANRRARGFAALVLALVVHAGLFWAFMGRQHDAPVRRTDMSFVVLDAFEAPLKTTTRPSGGDAPGGEQTGGKSTAEAAPDPSNGDGTSSNGRGGRVLAPAAPEVAPAAIATPGGATRAEGPASGLEGGMGGMLAGNAYQRALRRHISPFRLYPAKAAIRRSEGVVVVRFRLDRAGGIQEAWVVRPSPDPVLDQAALDTLWRAEPMPPVPSDIPTPVEVELPVPFRLPSR